jgi:hypothetical protein
MAYRTLCPLLFFISSLLADDTMLLDDMMNKEDQRRTGVQNLSPKQKVILEAWLNDHCPCMKEDLAQAPTEQALFLSINIDGGKKIQLSDGSLWEVDPRDTNTSGSWLSPMPIKIIPSGDLNFPSRLMNKNTGISVRARQAILIKTTPAPQSTPPASSESTAPQKP